jgi:VIT1/CCC1 family predicted Fe2+/Mn2+ transporter
MTKHFRNISAGYLRAFIFGVEDSLVSTVGLLSGIAIAGATQQAIFTTGIVLILVEGFSMAVGDFLSEYSAESYVSQAEVPFKRSFVAAFIMFFSYIISGMVPLFPYLIMAVDYAFIISIGLSLTALFALGVIGAKMSNIPAAKSGIRAAIVGGAAIAIGIFIGNLLKL